MLKFRLGRAENVDKGEKCWFPAFSPFPTMFSKGFFLKVVKSRDRVVKWTKFSVLSVKSRKCQVSSWSSVPVMISKSVR